MDLKTFTAHLWQAGTTGVRPNVFALIDGARNPVIAQAVFGSGLDYACLYAGNLPPPLKAVAPYIVQLEPTVRFTRELFEQGWGNSWGLFVVAPSTITLDQQRRHFRTLLRVQDELGRKLIFRFYDPRVFRVYLPTCNENEAKQVFGPNSHFLVEDEPAAALVRYQRVGSQIVRDQPCA